MNSYLIKGLICLLVTVAIILFGIIPLVKLVWGVLKNIFHMKNKTPIKFISQDNTVTLAFEKTEKKKIEYVEKYYYQGAPVIFDGGSKYIVEFCNKQRYKRLLDKMLNWDKVIFKIKFKPSI